jgi:hypothetical protein
MGLSASERERNDPRVGTRGFGSPRRLGKKKIRVLARSDANSRGQL